MTVTHRNLLSTLLLVAASIIASACATTSGGDKPKPLVIQEQGSFAVGGTVITNPGTYDPLKLLSADGQTFMVITLTCSIKSR